MTGQWCNLLKVTRPGIVSRHRHPGIVVGYVLKAGWKYDEHEWTAREGGFVYEPPGEIHTLRVPEHRTGGRRALTAPTPACVDPVNAPTPQLKTWRVLREFRCWPRRASRLAKTITS